jgi:hypothetical protein
MAVSHAYLVLVVALGNILELPCEDEVCRSRLLLLYRHFQRLPWLLAHGRDHIDGWLHTRLREGDGYAFCHSDIGCSRYRWGEEDARRIVDAGTGGVGRAASHSWENVDRIGECYARNIVSS